jgi:hypothetical protein
VILLPPPRELPFELKRGSFGRIRAALLDAFDNTLKTDVLPIETVIQHFSDFDNIFNHPLALTEVLKSAQQYGAGRDIRYLAISDIIVSDDAGTNRPMRMYARLFESIPDANDMFRLVHDTKSESLVGGLAAQSELLALIVGYRLMRDILTRNNVTVSQQTEQKLSEVFSDAFRTAWQSLMPRPRLPYEVVKLLNGATPCHDFQCLDTFDNGLSAALSELADSVNLSTALNTQRAMLKADGGLP